MPRPSPRAAAPSPPWRGRARWPRIEPGARHIGIDVVAHRRDAECCEIVAEERAGAGAGIGLRHVPLHEMIGEIGERISERRELPVEHGKDSWRIGGDDRVVEPEIAVHQPHRPGRRQVARQPFDETLHVRDVVGLRSSILLRPALDLARHIVLTAPEISKPDRGGVEAMQAGDGRVRRVVDGRALGRIGGRQMRLPEHAAVDKAHDKERGADDFRIVAIGDRLRHREVLPVESGDDAEFAVHRMRRRQELARRLAAQHEAALRCLEKIGRIRLPALELAHRERPAKARDFGFEIGGEPCLIEAQRCGDLLGAGKRGLAIDAGHGVRRLEQFV
jgi:hypothetical protein